MKPQQFAVISIRVLGITCIVFGIVFLGSGLTAQSLGETEAITSYADLHLKDAYYFVSGVERAWIIPGMLGLVLGILLFLLSGKLGGWIVPREDT